ncbi:Uma2 family endonuclease [Candidatus Poribacteria bacterium]|nr:Uma2 family endonuclease [Candidatus Poribacteria bacterium]
MTSEAVLFQEPQVKTPKPAAAAGGRATPGVRSPSALPIIAIDLPVLYEDEGQEEMGEHTIHTLTDDIIRLGLESHLAERPNHHVFSNLNLHYHRIDKNAYVSPDEMVVVAELPPHPSMGSYRVGETGPAPILAVEVLSRRTYQQQDVSPTGKPVIYAELGVAEYILVDVRGEFLPQRLLLKRLNADVPDENGVPSWQDERDADGGVTSQLGFRLIIEADGQVRVLDATSGRRYLRPEEVEMNRQQAEQRAISEAAARHQAEQRAAEAEQRAAKEAIARQTLEDELARLKAELAQLRRSPQ